MKNKYLHESGGKGKKQDGGGEEGGRGGKHMMEKDVTKGNALSYLEAETPRDKNFYCDSITMGKERRKVYWTTEVSVVIDPLK